MSVIEETTNEDQLSSDTVIESIETEVEIEVETIESIEPNPTSSIKA